eukprot:6881436-Prymnesium_polylepis.1
MVAFGEGACTCAAVGAKPAAHVGSGAARAPCGTSCHACLDALGCTMGRTCVDSACATRACATRACATRACATRACARQHALAQRVGCAERSANAGWPQTREGTTAGERRHAARCTLIGSHLLRSVTVFSPFARRAFSPPLACVCPRTVYRPFVS